jgi:hypothetical protein
MNSEDMNLAESIAAVSITLAELIGAPDWTASIPAAQGYVYHIFDGFPGFWAFCAKAGIVFRSMEDDDDEEEWIENVESFCDFVSAEMKRVGRPLSEDEMRKWKGRAA